MSLWRSDYITFQKIESQMIFRRFNNVKRTEWNKRCREQLSEHICKNHAVLWSSSTNTTQNIRLKIFIKTSQVRFKTNPNDPYAWKKIDEKKHLFFKNLSDLSTKQLKKLCENVDKSFVVIRKAFLSKNLPAESEKKIVCATHL